jgi:hypothetical protein
MEIKTKNYFAKNVHIRGKELEERAESYLLSMHIPFRRNKNNGIDFVINGYMHLDCVAQGQSGSIGDKLPHKAFKYIQKYNLKDIYILHPNSPITKTVGEHLVFLEKQFNTKIHILDWNDFTYLMNGGKFDTRKPYAYVKDSTKAKNTPANNISINKFFKFKK